MRKRLKIKKGYRNRCLCKGYKLGYWNRWKAKDEAGLKQFERERQKGWAAWQEDGTFGRNRDISS